MGTVRNFVYGRAVEHYSVSHSNEFISCGPKVVSAFNGIEHVANIGEAVADSIDRSCCGLSEMGLELGKGHFDRVEIGRIGRQKQHPGAPVSDDFFGAGALVNWQVVENDDVSLLQSRRQFMLEIEFEPGFIHGRIDQPRRDHGKTAQAGDECLGEVMAQRSIAAIARSHRRPTHGLRHTGVGRSFVNEDNAMQFATDRRKTFGDPEVAAMADIRPQLLAGDDRFF
jgi:hypothetical protein